MPIVTGISLGASKIAAKSLNHTAALVKALLRWALISRSLLGTLPQWALRRRRAGRRNVLRLIMASKPLASSPKRHRLARPSCGNRLYDRIASRGARGAGMA